MNKGRTLRNSPVKILKFCVLCTYTLLAEYNQLDLIDDSLIVRQEGLGKQRSFMQLPRACRLLILMFLFPFVPGSSS